jgi:parvulin-like peptidyl-prolyl isomerase
MKQLTLSVILGFWAVFGIAVSGQSEIVDRLVATVNGEAITLSMVEDAMNAIWTDPQQTPRSQQDALQKLIDRKLSLQEARKLGLDVIVSEESLSREAAKIVSRFGSPTEFSEALQRRGITREDLEENLIEEIMIQEMVGRKFRLFVEVTDGEASDYFEQHRERYAMPEAVHLNQIFFQLSPGVDQAAKEIVRKNAEATLKELRNGADFSRYADEEEPVDYVTVDQLIPVVAAAISRLKAGEISDLIETPVGYFIIKLNDRRPARQATFNEVKEEIRARLLQQKTDDEFKAWLKRQREVADIRMVKS